MSKKALFIVIVLSLAFLGFITIEVKSETYVDTLYISDTFNELFHSSAIIVRARPVEKTFFKQPNQVDIYEFRVIEVLKGTCSETIGVRIDTTFRNEHELELSEYQIDDCEVLLFLSPFGKIYYLEPPNAGLFVVLGDQVYSIGELDRDFSTITRSVHVGGQKYSDFIKDHIQSTES